MSNKTHAKSIAHLQAISQAVANVAIRKLKRQKVAS